MAKIARIKKRLNGRSVVLVGLMGAGKTVIGRRLAGRLEMPFVDADSEIELAAGMSVADIFEEHGEASFRDGEQKVISRLLTAGAQVLATGGGAFMNKDTRSNIKDGAMSVWLKADLDVLMERVMRKNTRPLLQTKDPRAVMKKLLDERYPIYGLADVTVQSRNVAHDIVVNEIIQAIAKCPANGQDNT